MILRARLVLPVSREPIEDGAVAILGKRITAVGRWRDLRREPGPKFDLGKAMLAPGLVNAHCHLDYTDMAGLLPPQKSFVDWIKLMPVDKADLTYNEFAKSWVNGAEMLVRNGVTTVGDYEAVPELLPEVWTATAL